MTLGRGMEGRMSWQPEIDELRRREALARRMGGPDKVKRQHDGGKLTVRERIERCSTRTRSTRSARIAGKRRIRRRRRRSTDFTPANFVMGRGRIDGRPVVVGGDDFTVRGGAADASIWREAGACRADGARAAPADRAAGRRHRRRRLGEDARDDRLHLRAGAIPAGTWVVANLAHGAGRGARPRLGRRPRRGAARRPATIR